MVFKPAFISLVLILPIWLMLRLDSTLMLICIYPNCSLYFFKIGSKLFYTPFVAYIFHSSSFNNKASKY